MSDEHDLTFRSMGSDVRLLIGTPLVPSAPRPGGRRRARARLRRGLRRPPVAVSPRQRAERAQRRPPRTGARFAAAAGGRPRRHLGRRAQRRPRRPDARRSDSSGPATTPRSTAPRPPRCADALAVRPGPPARPRPNSARSWQRDLGRRSRGHRPPPARPADRHRRHGQGPVRRRRRPPPGGYTRYVVDCGGDLAIGGVGAQLEPYQVEIEHPLTGETIRTVEVASRRHRTAPA